MDWRKLGARFAPGELQELLVRQHAALRRSVTLHARQQRALAFIVELALEPSGLIPDRDEKPVSDTWFCHELHHGRRILD
jgi:hypothetical protein